MPIGYIMQGIPKLICSVVCPHRTLFYFFTFFLVIKKVMETGAKELMDDSEKTTSQKSRNKEGGI